jgi:hypothetical protein
MLLASQFALNFIRSPGRSAPLKAKSVLERKKNNSRITITRTESVS